jgi:glutamate racemase
MAIGFFDSGVGGLSIWSQVRRRLPHASTIYLADSRYAPYGSLNPAQIRQRAVAIAHYLIAQGSRLVVVACNTATTTSPIAYLRRQFPATPFVGVEPGVKVLAAKTKTRHVAVFATQATCQSMRLKQLIDTHAQGTRVDPIPTPEWVSLVESGRFRHQSALVILRKYLDQLDASIDYVALGCTHYHFLLPLLRKITSKRVHFIDISAAVAKRVESLAGEYHLTASDLEPTHQFISTASPDKLKAALKATLNLDYPVVSVSI